MLLGMNQVWELLENFGETLCSRGKRLEVRGQQED